MTAPGAKRAAPPRLMLLIFGCHAALLVFLLAQVVLWHASPGDVAWGRQAVEGYHVFGVAAVLFYMMGLFALQLPLMACTAISAILTAIWAPLLFRRRRAFRVLCTISSMLLALLFLYEALVGAMFRRFSTGYSLLCFLGIGLLVACIVYLFRSPKLGAWLQGGPAPQTNQKEVD